MESFANLNKHYTLPKGLLDWYNFHLKRVVSYHLNKLINSLNFMSNTSNDAMITLLIALKAAAQIYMLQGMLASIEVSI